MSLSPLLAGYDQVILDLDGTVYVGDEATPRAPEAIAALRAAGFGIAFVTNDGRLAPEEYVRKLWSLGCTAAVEEVVSVGAAIQHYLAERPPGTGAFVIGSPAIVRHVSDAGHRILNGTPREEAADVVVIVCHDRLSYDELRTATRAVLSGAGMVAGGRDRTFPAAGGPAPGSGAFVAALEYATGQPARSVGKPDPQMFRTAQDRLGPGHPLVIGDRLGSDLAGAAAAGLDAAIVLTGVSSRAEAEAATEPRPVAVVANLGTLVLSSPST